MNPTIDDFENKLLEDPENEFLLNLIEKSQIKNINKMKAPTMYMLEMLNDLGRNEFYKSLIEKYVQNKSVLEIGSGLGLLCSYLVNAKCSSLVSCEVNNHNFSISKKFLSDNGINDKVKLLNKSSFELRLKKDLEKVDFIVQELWPNNGFSENILSTVNNAKRFLRPGGKVLPGNFELNVVPVNLSFNEKFRFNCPSLNINSWDHFFNNRFLNYKRSNIGKHSKKRHKIFSIDLNSDYSMKDSYIMPANALKGYNAVLIYLRIFHEDISLSTWDESEDQYTASSWKPLIYKFEEGSSLLFSYDRDLFSVTSVE